MGTHPLAGERDAAITHNERYEHVHYLFGDAATTPVGGLHVHVGMPDAETAIRTFNGLRRDLPLLQALSANSPLRHGRDTGLAWRVRYHCGAAAFRSASRDAQLRPLLRNERVLTRAADVPDYT